MPSSVKTLRIKLTFLLFLCNQSTSSLFLHNVTLFQDISKQNLSSTLWNIKKSYVVNVQPRRAEYNKNLSNDLPIWSQSNIRNEDANLFLCIFDLFRHGEITLVDTTKYVSPCWQRNTTHRTRGRVQRENSRTIAGREINSLLVGCLIIDRGIDPTKSVSR